MSGEEDRHRACHNATTITTVFQFAGAVDFVFAWITYAAVAVHLINSPLDLIKQECQIKLHLLDISSIITLPLFHVLDCYKLNMI